VITEHQVRDVIGSTAYGSDGDKIGKIGQVYLDDRTGQPEWLTVQTGMFGNKESFVPLQRAEMRDGGAVALPYDKSTVKSAPQVEPDGGHLSEREESELYRYYEVDGDRPQGVGREAADGDGDAMTRSEERMRVGTERRETGRARLRKYVVTENVQTTVPVSHEEARVVREPITDENRDAARSGPAIAEGEHEVTLHEERPVVDAQAEPVERVRLEPETVTEDETVSGEVRKERIEAEGAADRRR
jgi:uncharacterized protein (TIGR02271 family)